MYRPPTIYQQKFPEVLKSDNKPLLKCHAAYQTLAGRIQEHLNPVDKKDCAQLINSARYFYLLPIIYY